MKFWNPGIVCAAVLMAMPAAAQDDPEFTVSTVPPERLIYLTPTYKHVERLITDNDGNVMVPNPMRDWGMRKALSLAANREAIRDCVMQVRPCPPRTSYHRAFSGMLMG